MWLCKCTATFTVFSSKCCNALKFVRLYLLAFLNKLISSIYVLRMFYVYELIHKICKSVFETAIWLSPEESARTFVAHDDVHTNVQTMRTKSSLRTSSHRSVKKDLCEEDIFLTVTLPRTVITLRYIIHGVLSSSFIFTRLLLWHLQECANENSRKNQSPLLNTTTTLLFRSLFSLSAESCFLPPVLLHVRRHGDLGIAAGIRRGLHQTLGLAGLAVSHQDRHGDSPGRAAAAAGLDALARRPLRLVPVVLEPDLYLGGRETDNRGQVFPLGRAQITLLTETSLQLVRLRLGEQHPPLALLVLGLMGGLRRLSVAGLMVVLVLLRFLVLRRLVAVLLLRRERHVRDRWTRRVRLLENWNEEQETVKMSITIICLMLFFRKKRW